MKRYGIIRKAITMMFVVGCAVTSLASVSMATTYYVSTTGNDSNGGTATSTPFKTIQKSLNTVRPGDTVQIMSGTYNESLVLNTSGTSSARITLQPYNNGTVTINSGASRAVRLNFGQGGYYTFSYLNFTSTRSVYNSNKDYSIDLGIGGPGWWGYGPAMAATPVIDDSSYSPNVTMGDNNGYNGFIVEYCNITGSIGFMGHNNIVRYCNLEGNESFTNGVCEMTIISHHNLYTHNNVHGMVNRGFWLMDNVSFDEVSYNKIWNDAITSAHTGVDFDCVPYPGHNNLIKGNTSYNQNIAFEFENQFNSVMDGNLTYSNGNTGLEVIAYGADQGVSPEWRTYAQNNVIKNNIAYGCNVNAIAIICSCNNWVINNTVDGNSASLGAIGLPNQGTNYTANNTYIANNIITNNSTGINNQGGTGVTITNNLFFGNSNNGSMGASYQTSDPLYANRSGHVYTVPSNSPAVDHGINPTTSVTNPYGNTIQITVATDFTGTTTRPQGAGYDIGAYEFATSTASSVAPAAPSGLSVL